MKKIAFLPYKRQKTLKAKDLMKKKVGEIIVVENTSGLLDLVRENPMEAIKSQYRIGNEAGVHEYMKYVLYAMSDSDITFGEDLVILHWEIWVEGFKQ